MSRVAVSVAAGGRRIVDAVDVHRGVQGGLRRVGRLSRGAGPRPADLRDAGAGLSETPSQGHVGDEAGVVAGVRRGRHRGDQGVQIAGATDSLQLPAAGERGRDADRIGRLPTAIQLSDDLVHQPVRRPVKVDRAQDFGDIGDRVSGQQHPAEHCLLGGHVVRRDHAEVAAVAGKRRHAGCPTPAG